jgi:glutamyl-tRNA synthetase
MQEFVRDEAIGIGQIIHAVRVAVTGKAVGFGMFETLAILGRQRCVTRIDIVLDRLSS